MAGTGHRDGSACGSPDPDSSALSHLEVLEVWQPLSQAVQLHQPVPL